MNTISKETHLLYKQFLAHSDALVKPLLVLLQEFLLFINLSPQVTVSLVGRDSGGRVNLVA